MPDDDTTTRTLIADGLRAIADLLDADGRIPAPYPDLIITVDSLDKLERAAAAMGSDYVQSHGIVSTSQTFAGITLRVSYVPKTVVDSFVDCSSTWHASLPAVTP